MSDRSQAHAAQARADLECAVAALRDSDAWRRSLAVLARFHRYSFRNQLLIGLQMPDAAYVCGFKRTLSIGMLAKIYREDGGEPSGWTPLGSCFPFRRRTHFITAAHCLDGLEPDDVTVLGVFLRSLTPSSQFTLHPTADLAVVVFDHLLSEHADIVTPFDSIDPRYGLGTDIATLGYPIDSLGPRANFPTARMLKGHIQRMVYSETHFGRSTPGEEHQGVELSIYTDAGLSGAPVFRAPASSSVIGMVTGSIESSVRSETIEEFTDETGHYKVIRQDVLRFGLAMTLDRFESWLNEQIPSLTDRSDSEA